MVVNIIILLCFLLTGCAPRAVPLLPVSQDIKIKIPENKPYPIQKLNDESNYGDIAKAYVASIHQADNQIHAINVAIAHLNGA